MNETINVDTSQSKASENPWQKMANEVLTENTNNHRETIEESFFETRVEFDPDQLKEFRDTLLNADEHSTEQIIKQRVSFLEKSCDKVEKISPNRFDEHIHRGYIGSNTSIGFQGGVAYIGSHYKIKDTSYLHEMVSLLQRNKETIKNGAHLFNNMERFLNSYFGIPQTNKDIRTDVIDRKANLQNPDLTDEEFFATIDNIDISIFKGEHAAQCSERAAMAQNILSFFGYETYYANGNASIDDATEGHAFNIVTDNKGQKALIDFSITSTINYRGTNWFTPTHGKISNFDAFLKGDKVKVTSYESHIDENGKAIIDKTRNIEYDTII